MACHFGGLPKIFTLVGGKGAGELFLTSLTTKKTYMFSKSYAPPPLLLIRNPGSAPGFGAINSSTLYVNIRFANKLVNLMYVEIPVCVKIWITYS